MYIIPTFLKSRSYVIQPYLRLVREALYSDYQHLLAFGRKETYQNGIHEK